MTKTKDGPVPGETSEEGESPAKFFIHFQASFRRLPIDGSHREIWSSGYGNPSSPLAFARRHTRKQIRHSGKLWYRSWKVKFFSFFFLVVVLLRSWSNRQRMLDLFECLWVGIVATSWWVSRAWLVWLWRTRTWVGDFARYVLLRSDIWDCTVAKDLLMRNSRVGIAICAGEAIYIGFYLSRSLCIRTRMDAVGRINQVWAALVEVIFIWWVTLKDFLVSRSIVRENKVGGGSFPGVEFATGSQLKTGEWRTRCPGEP